MLLPIVGLSVKRLPRVTSSKVIPSGNVMCTSIDDANTSVFAKSMLKLPVFPLGTRALLIDTVLSAAAVNMQANSVSNITIFFVIS